jgi:hypothetical protein
MAYPVCRRVDNIDSTSQEKVISLARRDVCRIHSGVGSICTIDFVPIRLIQNRGGQERRNEKLSKSPTDRGSGAVQEEQHLRQIRLSVLH